MYIRNFTLGLTYRKRFIDQTIAKNLVNDSDNTTDFDHLLQQYQLLKSNPFLTSEILDSIPVGTKRFKNQLLNILHTSIKNKDSKDLDFYLALAYQDGLDEAYKPVLKDLSLSTWHNYHEDIVVCIGDLKDDIFIDDLYMIAITPNPYRQYDDELESTLRKCVHALKAINSPKASERLEHLKATGNNNVLIALEMYK